MNIRIILPTIVAILYILTALDCLYNRYYAQSLVWFSYGIANVGLILGFYDGR